MSSLPVALALAHNADNRLPRVVLCLGSRDLGDGNYCWSLLGICVVATICLGVRAVGYEHALISYASLLTVLSFVLVRSGEVGPGFRAFGASL